jgi:hypothetical protein
MGTTLVASLGGIEIKELGIPPQSQPADMIINSEG